MIVLNSRDQPFLLFLPCLEEGRDDALELRPSVLSSPSALASVATHKTNHSSVLHNVTIQYFSWIVFMVRNAI